MQVVLTRGVIGKADEFRIALLGDMDVVEGIGAAHVERARRAVGTCHAKARQKFLHAIEIGRPQPPIGNVGDFDVRHADHHVFGGSRLFSSCPALCRASTSSYRKQDVDGRDKRGHDVGWPQAYPKFNSLKKSLPLSSMTMKAGKFSTSMRHAYNSIRAMPTRRCRSISSRVNSIWSPNLWRMPSMTAFCVP